MVTSSTPGARKEDAGMGRGWIVVGEREREKQEMGFKVGQLGGGVGSWVLFSCRCAFLRFHYVVKVGMTNDWRPRGCSCSQSFPHN